MPASSSATVTVQSLSITSATKERVSSMVCNIGRKFSRRYDAKNSSAIALASSSVAQRRRNDIGRAPELGRPGGRGPGPIGGTGPKDSGGFTEPNSGLTAGDQRQNCHNSGRISDQM